MNRSDERRQISGAHHADHDEEGFGAHGFDAEEKDDEGGGGKRIGVTTGGRVESGGHDESTGRGPHTKREPKGDMGASVSGVGGTKAAERSHTTEHVSREHDEKISHSDQGGKAGEGSSMSGVGAAKSAQARKQKDDLNEQLGEHEGGIRGGREIKRVKVDADHVMGDGGEIGTSSAEGRSDMASAGANRKEAMEPEREENEKAAMGRERSVPTKNTIGWGERETIAKHTI
jgi:hypothetical protein